MSRLSNAISDIGDIGTQLVHKPLSGLANILTVGQLGNIKNALNKSGISDTVNKNKNALLGAVTGGLTTGLPLGLVGNQMDKAKQSQDQFNTDQTNKKTTANNNLNDILNQIGGQQPQFSSPSGVSSGMGLQKGAIPFDSLPPDQQQRLAQQSPALQQRLQQIIGSGTGDAQTSANQILNANDLTKQLSQGTLDTQAAARKQQISDLSNLLTQQAQTQYQRQLPGLYEDLNSRGLLRSSDLGNQMALKQQQSYQDVANQLGQQQLGYNDQYIQGLGNISNQFNAGIGSALQREQSLQDYATQIKASQALGQAVAPMQPYSGKTPTSVATNAIGGIGAAGQAAGGVAQLAGK